MKVIFNASEFIEKIRIELNRLQENGKQYWYGFDLIFEQRDTGENVKRYFDGIGYKTELRWCNNCMSHKCDIIIEIPTIKKES
jgi:hypothetical protein